MVASHCEHLEGFKEDEVNISGVIADKELVLAQEMINLWHALFILINDLSLVVLFSANANKSPSEIIDNTCKHAHIRFVSCILSQEGLIPNLSNVLVDGNSLRQLRFSMNEVW